MHIGTQVWLFVACPEPIEFNSEIPQPSDTKHMVYIEDTEHTQLGFWIDSFEFPNRPNQVPLASVSFPDAQKMCSETGKRLCTAYEWRQACLGKMKFRFGYGNSYESDRCHTSASIQSGHSSMINAREMLTESGQKQHCQTDGVFDLIGNLEEWVLDDWQGREGSLEGGAWYTYREYADCSGEYSRQPDYRTPLTREVYSAGFRCCWTPTAPTTEEIRQDRTNRSQSIKLKPYATQNEREIAPGLWMDIYEYPNQLTEQPLTNVSWEEANELCDEAGKRLCSAVEWEKGCSGNLRSMFPYGNTYIPDLCSVQTVEPSNSGKFWGCQSESGIHDLIGSVWEWTSTSIDADVLRRNPTESLYEIRGGSWFVDQRKAVCLPDSGYPLTAGTAKHSDLGFRCCKGEVPNSTMILEHSMSCPNDMVSLSKSCIDQYEFPNIKVTKPLADANYQLATEACSQQGKHLCTDSEWMEACQGRENHRWPYGNEYQSGMCNDHGWMESDKRGSVSPSGSFEECKTIDGIFDLSGNLWEWTLESKDGRIRGGGWELSAGLGQCRSYSDPIKEYHAGEVGFRCCATQLEAQRLQAP